MSLNLYASAPTITMSEANNSSQGGPMRLKMVRNNYFTPLSASYGSAIGSLAEVTSGATPYVVLLKDLT
jgi:hypothetical protein